MSVAYECALQGQKVAVVDRGRIAGGMTARTTAHLVSLCDDYFSKLIDLRGRELARSLHESQSTAIGRVEAIQKMEGIACDFRRVDGFLFLSSEIPDTTLERELEAASQIGVAVDRQPMS